MACNKMAGRRELFLFGIMFLKIPLNAKKNWDYVIFVLAGGVYVNYVMCWGSGCIIVCYLIVPSLVFNVKVKLCHMCGQPRRTGSIKSSQRQ